MVDRFTKRFYSAYPFWILIVSIFSLGALAFFGYQAREIQTALKLIEETRQKEKFCNDLQIHFDVNPYSSHKPEGANYDLRLHNKSSRVYKSLETDVEILFEDPKTRAKKKAVAFTFPAQDLPPSNKPLFLVDNKQLISTFQRNISESRNQIDKIFKPKYFYFIFKWEVNIGNEKLFDVTKRQTFVIEGLH